MTVTFIFTQVTLMLLIVVLGAYFIYSKNVKPYLIGYFGGVLIIACLFCLGLLGFKTPAIAIMLTGYTVLFSLVIGALSKNYWWLIGLLIIFLPINRKTVFFTEGTGSLSLINLPDAIACGACGGSVNYKGVLLFIFLVPIIGALVTFWTKNYFLTKNNSFEKSGEIGVNS